MSQPAMSGSPVAQPSLYDLAREEGAGIPEGSEAGVDDDASARNESTSTSGEVFARVALLLSTSSCVNSASIRRISVEEDGVTFISLVGSRGTPARRHNSVIRTGKGRDVDLPLGHDRTKASCLRMTQNGLVLGWHDNAADETKQVPGGDVHNYSDPL
ncbi:hypothetical protein H5410_015117 [Solanum commersonii]|uniref:Uncharacterized protein n=1 Tax=Solanum commersonii TaxID=4109 RepID=A0A9J5ZSP1_SOLCO|nr:hypothetical protein H5410_015117 [Solanum commersonii]